MVQLHGYIISNRHPPVCYGCWGCCYGNGITTADGLSAITDWSDTDSCGQSLLEWDQTRPPRHATPVGIKPAESVDDSTLSLAQRSTTAFCISKAVVQLPVNINCLMPRLHCAASWSTCLTSGCSSCCVVTSNKAGWGFSNDTISVTASAMSIASAMYDDKYDENKKEKHGG